MPTPRAAAPYIVSNQSQKGVTYNEAMNIFDTLVDATIIDMTSTAPPGSPTTGDAYIIAVAATGDWVDEDGNLAFYNSGLDRDWETPF